MLAMRFQCKVWSLCDFQFTVLYGCDRKLFHLGYFYFSVNEVHQVVSFEKQNQTPGMKAKKSVKLHRVIDENLKRKGRGLCEAQIRENPVFHLKECNYGALTQGRHYPDC